MHARLGLTPPFQDQGWSGVTTVCGDLPAVACLIMPQDVHASIIGIDPEPALLGGIPSVGHGAYRDPALAQPERDRLLFAAIAAIALHAYAHALLPLILSIPYFPPVNVFGIDKLTTSTIAARVPNG